MPNGAKKSLYIFLTALLGVLLFLMIDRVIIFFYLFAIANSAISLNISYGQFLLFDYFSLTIIMMLGAWYGIWLGLYWYKKVYEEQSHQGFVNHLATNYFPGKPRREILEGVSELKGRLQSDLDRLDNFLEAKEPEFPRFQRVAAIKRSVARRRAPKKLNGLRQAKQPSALTSEEVQMEE